MNQMDMEEYDSLGLNLSDDMKRMLQIKGITPESLRAAMVGLGNACNALAEEFKRTRYAFERYAEAIRIQEEKRAKNWKKKRFYE